MSSCSVVNGPDDLLAPPPGAGDDGLSCGDGTVEHDGACWPYDPTDETPPVTTATPPGGTVIAAPFYVLLESDEPATIYYTLDGSEPTTDSTSEVSPAEVFDIPDDGELKFFAVDLAGNEEAVNTAAYTIDQDPPGPVTDLGAVTGADVSLTWQNPGDADFAGVLVVRSGGLPSSFVPEPGTAYTEGQMVGGGQDVAFVGDASDFVDSAPRGGAGYYAVWAYDDVLNYSTLEQTVSDIVPVEIPQDGALEIDTSGLTVTVTKQPRDFFIEGGDVTYNPNSEELKFTLEVTSLVGRYVHNMKLATKSFSQGLIVAGTTGIFDNKPTMYFGPQSTPAGSSFSRTIKAAGVAGDPPIVNMTFELSEHPTARVGGGKRTNDPIGLSDTSGSGFGQGLNCPSQFMPVADGMRSQCNMGGGYLTADDRWLYVAFASHPVLLKYDMETLSPVLGVELSTDVGRALEVVPSPDGTHLYVTVQNGRHRRTGTSTSYIKTQGFNGDIELVKLATETLEVIDRVTLFTAATMGDARGLSITADGTQGAVALDRLSQVVHLDLENMVVLQAIDTTETRPRVATITPDGTSIYVFYNQSTDGEIFATSDYSSTTLPILAGGTSQRVGNAIFGPDGRLYLARKPFDGSSALVIFDPSDPVNLQTGLFPGNQLFAVTMGPDGQTLWGKTDGQIKAVDIATDMPILSQQAGTTPKGHHLSITR